MIKAQTEEDWLWLCAIPELEWKEKMTLLHYFGSPAGIRAAAVEELEEWEKLGRGWIRKLYPGYAGGFLEQVQETMRKKQVSFVSREHPGFPRMLRSMADCPYGLFFKGSLPSSRPVSVGIVGARACSGYGTVLAAQIGEKLAQRGVQVISGMAMGIDGYAQMAAVEAGGASFAVLGCGPDVCYPRSNIDLYMRILEKGGIISEYPCGTMGRPYRFPVRNRIIAGLSEVLAVIEAGAKSGSLITAGQALDQGREVYALPGRIDDVLSAGCNALIRDGAGVILSADSFVKELAESFRGRMGEEGTGGSLPGNLTKAERSVYAALDYTPASQEQLMEKCMMKMGEVQSALLALQLQDLAAEIGKNLFVRQR